MKTLFCLLAAAVLTGFINKSVVVDDDVNGYWMGYYRSEMINEKLIVKLNIDEHIVFYTSGINERTKMEGTYKIYGDSVSFSYTTTGGEEVVMQGHFNRRRTYMDGICRTNNKPTGSFYLEKQKLEERFAKP